MWNRRKTVRHSRTWYAGEAKCHRERWQTSSPDTKSPQTDRLGPRTCLSASCVPPFIKIQAFTMFSAILQAAGFGDNAALKTLRRSFGGAYCGEDVCQKSSSGAFWALCSYFPLPSGLQFGSQSVPESGKKQPPPPSLWVRGL